MPPRNSTWTNMPPYDPVNQYYPNVPPGLQTMNMSHYPMGYRPPNSDYRPRGGSAPYNVFLEEFKQKLTYAKKIDIEELKGHMLELAKDQFGSRHLQKRIQESVLTEREIIYFELKDSLGALMTDAFGNYVVQMFIQYSQEEARNELIEHVIKRTGLLSLDMYGCRCV